MVGIYDVLLILMLAVAVGLIVWIVIQYKQSSPLRRSAARLEEVARFGQAILSAQFQLDALCEVVYQQTRDIIDTSNFQLGLFDEDDYVIMIWLRNEERLPQQRFPNAGIEGIIGWVRRAGQPLLVGDFEAEWDDLPAHPRYTTHQKQNRSALFVPFVAGGTCIGVIAVQSPVAQAYRKEDQRLLMVLANQAAGVIRNAQLLEQAQARFRQLQLVSQVSQQVTAVQPLEDLFKQIVSLIWESFDTYVVNIFTLNERDQHLHLQASTHEIFQKKMPSIPVEEGLVGWSVRHGQTAVVSDVTRDDRFFDDGVLNETRAELTVPLVVERRVVGVLDLQSNQSDSFDEDDVAVLETLGGQIALAIQEAETYAAERRQRERMYALTEASRAVVSILSLDELLEEVIELLTDYFGFDRTHIFLREDDRVVFRAGSGVHSGKWSIEELSYHIDDPGLISRCIRTGLPIVSGDVNQQDDYVPGPGVEDTQSELLIPIRMGWQTLGALDIQSTAKNAFTPDDAALAEALSDTIAIALRNATLYAREKRRRILAESMREVSITLGSSLEVTTVLDSILGSLGRVITYDAALVLLRDESGDYHVTATTGFDEQESLTNTIIPADAGNIPDVELVLEGYLGSESVGEYDFHYVPLSLGEEVLGYLAIVLATGQYSPEDLEMIQTFATQSAMAIANAQLYMAQREEAWVSTALLQVAEATSHSPSLDEVLQTVARITPLLVGVQWCAVLLAESGGYRIVEIEGVDQTLEKELVGYTIKPHRWQPLDSLIETGEPVLLDQMEIPMPSGVTASTMFMVQQGVMLPLYAKGEIVGTMLIGQSSGDNLLSQRKIQMVGGIANQAALAIESAQLYTAQQEETWVTTALLQVAEAVNAQVALRSTLETIVRLTALLVGVRHCLVMRWHDQHDVFADAVAYGFSQQMEQQLTEFAIYRGQYDYLQRVCDSPIPLTAGVGSELQIPEPLQALMPAPTILSLPLHAQGNLVGLMIVDLLDDDGPFDQRRINILAGIASQTSLAIETDRLQAQSAERERLDRELEVAQEIQASFLPDLAPTVPGWDVATFYRAARMVGGDFYDFIELPEGRWGIVVADVADKGMPAALYMALSRTLLRAVARNRENPAETLLRVNKLLLEDTRSDLFVTMWYAIWDPVEGSLFYSSAGHNPPIVVHQDGEQPHDVLMLRGIALGVLPEIVLNADKITLQRGDTVVLYTDGVTEAQDPRDNQFGLENLEQATRQHMQDGAQAVITGITDAVDAHSGTAPQFDDLTLMVIQRL